MKEQFGAEGGGVMMFWVFISVPLIPSFFFSLQFFFNPSSFRLIPSLIYCLIKKEENFVAVLATCSTTTNTIITTNNNLNECVIMHIFTQTSRTSSFFRICLTEQSEQKGTHLFCVEKCPSAGNHFQRWKVSSVRLSLMVQQSAPN